MSGSTVSRRGLPLRVRACAKINVTLRVLGVRPDGYHELRTVFQSLSLHDRLTFEAAPGPFSLSCNDPACPVDARNLVWRAAELVWRMAGRRLPVRDVRVRIDKRIPIQAGLGGGSSDAASTLRALSLVWCPGLTPNRLAEMARSLGADVPYFLTGGTALGVERGDRVFALPDAPPCWVVLVRPAFGVSTADAYRWLDEARGSSPHGPLARRSDGPYGDGGNDLEGPVRERHPVIGRLVGRLRRHGATWTAMSGSGSACFGLFSSAAAARTAAAAVRSARSVVVITRTQTSAEFQRSSRPHRPAGR